MRDGLDHILVAAASLEEGVSYVENLLGVRPQFGGAHPGQGTCNALIGFEDCKYLEIIAPDAASPAATDLARRINAMKSPALSWWAWRCADLEAAKARLRARGISCPDIREGARRTEDGRELRWRLLFLDVPSLGAAAPFLIDWGKSNHPSLSAPAGGKLVKLEIRHPDRDKLSCIIETIGAEGSVGTKASKTASITAVIDTQSSKAMRMVTPKKFPPYIL